MQVNTFAFDRAAVLHAKPGTMARAAAGLLWYERPVWPTGLGRSETMTSPLHRVTFIQGLTPDGRPFRPSDWAERLAGAMSCFRPEGVRGGIGSFIGYSPLCEPQVINGVKCVLVNETLRDIEPMAWDFVMDFARDNQLRLSDTAPGRDVPTND